MFATPIDYPKPRYTRLSEAINKNEWIAQTK